MLNSIQGPIFSVSHEKFNVLKIFKYNLLNHQLLKAVRIRKVSGKIQNWQHEKSSWTVIL